MCVSKDIGKMFMMVYTKRNISVIIRRSFCESLKLLHANELSAYK
jgi:hypothetical protein